MAVAEQTWSPLALSQGWSARKGALKRENLLVVVREAQFSSIVAQSVIGGNHVQTPIVDRQHASVFN
jgi:hypothetical protein